MTQTEDYGNAGANDADVATIRAIYDAFARRDVDAALPFVADDCEVFPFGTTSVTGREGPYVGHDGVREYFADAARVWEELTLFADDVRSAAGGVVVFGHVEGRLQGARVRRQVVWVWQVREGRARSMRVSDIGGDEPA